MYPIQDLKQLAKGWEQLTLLDPDKNRSLPKKAVDQNLLCEKLQW